MRDYFNRDEKDLHIKTIACQGEVESFIESEAITNEERKCLRYANTYLKKFTTSVLSRFGADYERRLQNTLSVNRLLLVGRYEPVKSAVRKLDEEKLLPLANKMKEQHCLFCEEENHKECAVCQFLEELNLEGVNPDGGCPYKM